jgi:glucose-1-phosphate thymidylyltransferase
MTKGIVLAGGKGTRLYPLTHSISKQLLPVYNKPMIYYPLQTLKDMGITDVLIIVSDLVQFMLFNKQLKSGEDYGMNIKYEVQESPNGLPEAFIIGEEFIGDDDVVLVLGDNVFITNTPLKASPNTIFTYSVQNPSAYGVVEVKDNKLVQIVEKPKEFVSNDAVVGLYSFTNTAVKLAKELKPSSRNELEIVDLIRNLDKLEGVNIHKLDGFWFDCGTHQDLLECANLIEAIEHRTTQIIGLH